MLGHTITLKRLKKYKYLYLEKSTILEELYLLTKTKPSLTGKQVVGKKDYKIENYG